MKLELSLCSLSHRSQITVQVHSIYLHVKKGPLKEPAVFWVTGRNDMLDEC